MPVIHLNRKNSPMVSTLAQGGPDPLLQAQNAKILRVRHATALKPELWSGGSSGAAASASLKTKQEAEQRAGLA